MALYLSKKQIGHTVKIEYTFFVVILLGVKRNLFRFSL